MARPKKATVEYFPHTTTHSSKSLFLLEDKWGNDGFAAWYKLLEWLGASEGHFIDCREESAVAFLAAKAHMSPENLIEILDTLAKLKAIDRDLWQRHRFVFCQHFVDGIAEVYRRRRVDPPTIDAVYDYMEATEIEMCRVYVDNNPAQTDFGGQYDDRKRQSRVKESRVEESRVEKEVSSSSIAEEIETKLPVETVENGTTMTTTEFSGLYNLTFGRPMPEILERKVEAYCKRFPAETIMEAFQKAGEYSARSFSYLSTILDDQDQKETAKRNRPDIPLNSEWKELKTSIVFRVLSNEGLFVYLESLDFETYRSIPKVHLVNKAKYCPIE